MKFCHKMGFPFQNDSKNLEPSYKKDLDFLHGSRFLKPFLKWIQIFWIVLNYNQRKTNFSNGFKHLIVLDVTHQFQGMYG